MSNLQLLNQFKAYLDPHVFLQVMTKTQLAQVSKHFDFGVDQRNLALQRLSALVRTRLVDELETEAQKLPNALSAQQLQAARDGAAKLQTELFTPELKQLLQQLTDISNAETLSPEDLKSRFPLLNEKERVKPNRSQLQKYITEKVINQSLTERAFKAASLFYDLGQYENSFQLLENLQQFIDANDRLEHLGVQSQWGRINIRLIQLFSARQEDRQRRIQSIWEDLKRLNSTIDRPQTQAVLKQKADILHVALLLTFSSSDPDYDQFLEIFAQEDYQKVIFTLRLTALHYIVVALLLSKNQNQNGDLNLDSLANLLDLNAQLRSSPLLSFVFELLGSFDFDAANLLLKDIKEQVANDFLLLAKSEQILKSARILVFTTYIKIFTQIDINTYARYLDSTVDEAEVWLVNVIRSQNLNAKIEGSTIQIEQQELDNQTEQILKLVKDIVPKTQMLVTNLDRLLQNEKK